MGATAAAAAIGLPVAGGAARVVSTVDAVGETDTIAVSVGRMKRAIAPSIPRAVCAVCVGCTICVGRGEAGAVCTKEGKVIADGSTRLAVGVSVSMDGDTGVGMDMDMGTGVDTGTGVPAGRLISGFPHATSSSSESMTNSNRE